MADIAYPQVQGVETVRDAFNAFLARVDGGLEKLVDWVDDLRNKTPFVAATALTTAQLLADFPASAANAGKYARVTDLYGSVDEIMRCRYDGTAYRWVPVRDNFAGINAATSGVVSIVPLVTPPILDLTGTLTGNVTVSMSTTNAWVGQAQVIRSRGVLSLLNITLNGLVGGATLPLLQGADRTVIYTAAGWRG